ncbi:MAG: class II glutamine amidotransferase [Victivallaceae bacterium]|nr:class II glutamine amidotransferase [Victivallaceae bacterium]
MSDPIKHECAVALLRLRKSPEYYVKKYGVADYGCRKLALLLEKQHNRGQDGAGMAALKLHPEPGTPPYKIEKSSAPMPLADLLGRIRPEEFSGELLLGHLRYGTFGRTGIDFCHPFVRQSAFLDRTLLLAGNFNLTDTREIFQKLIATGHHPASKADGYLILQLIAHYLEEARGKRVFDLAGDVLRRAAENFDGGYTLCGVIGDGSCFALRDPSGIRPAFYYFDDEIAVVASERPAIQTTFDCTTSEVAELPPGQALVIEPDGRVELRKCLEAQEPRRCVFERIYFSRSNDSEIHRERRMLGKSLVPQILSAVNGDFDNTFFSYIPNTAQVGFHGLLAELNHLAFRSGHEVRFGLIAVKDAKFRTFISDATLRKEFYMHVYDVTYGLVRPGSDNLVVLDDSIVRGNTMKSAILPILDRLGPKKIVIGSTAPPICYPDCYGIDMATLHELVAFEALIDLVNWHGKEYLLREARHEADAVLAGELPDGTNPVKKLYENFSAEELVSAIAARLKPDGLKAELEVVYQSCDALHACCPNHRGDWYFTGDYPTQGGYRVVSQALINYLDNNNERAY